MTEAERTAEIDRLEGKLRASEGREGMSERVKAINARLEELRPKLTAALKELRGE